MVLHSGTNKSYYPVALSSRLTLLMTDYVRSRAHPDPTRQGRGVLHRPFAQRRSPRGAPWRPIEYVPTMLQRDLVCLDDLY
jgi:hypothetical protein